MKAGMKFILFILFWELKTLKLSFFSENKQVSNIGMKRYEGFWVINIERSVIWAYRKLKGMKSMKKV